MAATELATAYVSLVPSLKGAGGAIARELGGVNLEGAGSDMGKSLGGGLLGSFKSLVAPALAVLGSGMFAGFIADAARASDATDKFKSTMNFAGLDTSAIDAATKAAKQYADQTVYDLPTIQATMAQLASNGVTNYTDLTKAAGNLNAVAGGNAETFKSVSRTLTQSAGAGKLMTEDWNMLADAIPGASGPLQNALKEAGAFEGNFKKAMETGQISSEEFQAAITKLGDTPIASEAARSTKTFEGALGNLNATINSGLMGALDAVKPQLTGMINGVATGIGNAFQFVGNAISGIKSLIMNGDVTPALLSMLGVEEDSPVIGALLWLQDKIWAVFGGIQNFIAGFTIPADSLTSQLNGAFSPAFAVGIRLQIAVQTALNWVRDFVAGFTLPPLDAAVLGPLDGLVGAGVAVRAKVEGVFNGIRDFIAGFTIPRPALLDAGVDMSGLVGVGATVRDLFGQLGAALAPLIPHIAELWSTLSPVNLLFQSIAPFIGPLVGMFANLAVTIGGSLVTAIVQILPSIMQLQTTLVGVFQGVLATALPLILQLVTMLGQTFAQLLPVLVPIITQVVALAATLLTQLAPIFTQLISTILPVVVSSLGLILGAITPLIGTIAGILIPIISALMPIVVTVFSVIADVVTNAMQIVQGIIQVVTGIISGNWAQVFSGLLNIVSGVFGFILSIISGALQLVISVVGNGLNAVFGFFVSIFSGAVSYVSGAFMSIVNGAGGMLSDLLGFFGGIGGKILGALGNVGQVLFDAGKNIVQGLIDGIGSMLGAIGRAVLNIVPEAIRGPFEQLMGIHSPSLVAKGWGHHIGDGLVIGLQDSYDPVAEATALLVQPPKLPRFASASARSAYGVDAVAGDTGTPAPGVQIDVHPSEKMSEENLAEIVARKTVGAIA